MTDKDQLVWVGAYSVDDDKIAWRKLTAREAVAVMASEPSMLFPVNPDCPDQHPIDRNSVTA